MSAHVVRRAAAGIFGRSWVRFGLVGVAATVTYAAMALIFERWGVPVLLGNALAYVTGFGVSYAGHRLWSFQSDAAHGRALPRFAAAQAIGLGLNTLIIATLMRLGLPYILAMPAAVAAVPVAIYFISKYWVFRAPASSPIRNRHPEP